MKKLGLAVALVAFAGLSFPAFGDELNCAQYLNQVANSGHSIDYELNYHLDRVSRLKTPFSTDAALIGGAAGLIFSTLSHNAKVIAGATVAGATAGHFVGAYLDKVYADKVQAQSVEMNQELSCLLKAKAGQTNLSIATSRDPAVAGGASKSLSNPKQDQADAAPALSSASQAK